MLIKQVYSLVRVFVDRNGRKNWHCNCVLLQLLAKLLNLLLDIPNLGHFAQDSSLCLRESSGPLAEPDWIGEHELDELKTSLQVANKASIIELLVLPLIGLHYSLL